MRCKLYYTLKCIPEAKLKIKNWYQQEYWIFIWEPFISSQSPILFILLLLWLDIKWIQEQHPRAGLNTQHVLYEQQARAGRNTQLIKSEKLISIKYIIQYQFYSLCEILNKHLDNLNSLIYLVRITIYVCVNLTHLSGGCLHTGAKPLDPHQYIAPHPVAVKHLDTGLLMNVTLYR